MLNVLLCFGLIKDQGPRTNSTIHTLAKNNLSEVTPVMILRVVTHGSVTMGVQGPVFTVSHLARTAFPPPYSSTSTSSSSKSVQSRILNTHSACSPIQSQSHATPLYKLDLEYSPLIKTGF